ncbi:MAG: P-II family nitrogen regulator, partial [Thermoguttaceae bacterium]
KIEIAIPDSNVQDVMQTIANTARTGQIGDGKIFVTNLDQTVRIRTGETGEQAL